MKTSYFSNNMIVHGNRNACEIIQESEVTEMLLAGGLETGTLYLQLGSCGGKEGAWGTLL